jgi:hypothetical protein
MPNRSQVFLFFSSSRPFRAAKGCCDRFCPTEEGEDHNECELQVFTITSSHQRQEVTACLVRYIKRFYETCRVIQQIPL